MMIVSSGRFDYMKQFSIRLWIKDYEKMDGGIKKS